MSEINRHNLSEVTIQWLLTKGYNLTHLNQLGKNGNTALIKATLDDYQAIDFSSNFEVLRILKNATK